MKQVKKSHHLASQAKVRSINSRQADNNYQFSLQNHAK